MQTLMTCLHIMYSTWTSPIPQRLSQASGSEKSRFYLWHSLLIVDQDGKWIREDEEASVNRGTCKPGAWCFVLSSFWPVIVDSNRCNCLQLSDVFLFFAASEFALALRSDCYGFTIPSTWVCVSAFSATCCGFFVMELSAPWSQWQILALTGLCLLLEAVWIHWEQASLWACLK